MTKTGWLLILATGGLVLIAWWLLRTRPGADSAGKSNGAGSLACVAGATVFGGPQAGALSLPICSELGGALDGPVNAGLGLGTDIINLHREVLGDLVHGGETFLGDAYHNDVLPVLELPGKAIHGAETFIEDTYDNAGHLLHRAGDAAETALEDTWGGATAAVEDTWGLATEAAHLPLAAVEDTWGLATSAGSAIVHGTASIVGKGVELAESGLSHLNPFNW